MKNSGKLTVTMPSDREIAMTREFNAPRRLIFDAYTKCELVTRWLGVFEEWKFKSCSIDLTVGGEYRYVWNGPKGATLGISGVFREIVRDERIVSTEQFDAPFNQGESLNTITFMERDRKTTLTITSLAPSKEIRDAMLKTGMTDGVTASFDNLDAVLGSSHVAGSSR
jgi:uncharacterized protein YndB with AHSA1/START domain